MSFLIYQKMRFDIFAWTTGQKRIVMTKMSWYILGMLYDWTLFCWWSGYDVQQHETATAAAAIDDDSLVENEYIFFRLVVVLFVSSSSCSTY